jgi:hypothetical protein
MKGQFVNELDHEWTSEGQFDSESTAQLASVWRYSAYSFVNFGSHKYSFEFIGATQMEA